MRFTTYSKYKGRWLDALNLESLMEHLSDFLMDGGFAGGAHYHPYWGWSGDEDVNSTDSLKNALLKALLESGQLTPEMIDELRGDGQGDEEIRKQIAELLDDLIAFHRDDVDPETIPVGFVPYSARELQELFGPDKPDISPDTLWRIHAAKIIGMSVTGNFPE